MRDGQGQPGRIHLRNWVLGTVTAAMGVGGLFISSRAGHGLAHIGGLLFFVFAVLFVFLLIKASYDETKESTSLDELRALAATVTGFVKPARERVDSRQTNVRTIGTADLRDALARGLADFRVQPTHLIILCVIYPIVGLFLARLTFGYEILPVLFPLVSGFALIGPLAATGLYELSRRREQGLDMSWWRVFGVLRSPSIVSIVILGVFMALIFVAWLVSAQAIYETYFGTSTPDSVTGFILQVFTTPSGWSLVLVGCGVGFVFAVVVLAISVVSIPMLLDRNVGVVMAVRTSIRAVLANPKSMTIWGFVVAGTLVIGSVPLFVGLAIVLPVLGHSTWHLYRKVVVW